MKNLKLMLVLLAAFCGSLCSFHADASKTIYAIVKTGWADVGAYAFNNSSEQNAKWPGQQMTKTGKQYDNSDVYSAVIADNFTTLIINNNLENNGAQSVDLTPTDGTLYIIKNDWDNGKAKVETVANYNGGEVSGEDAVPTDDLYLRGAFTEWNAQDGYKLTKNGNVFSRKFDTLPGGQDFKIGSATLKANNIDWKYGYSTSNNSMVADVAYDCPVAEGTNTNMQLKETLNNVTVTLDFSGSTPKLTFTEEPVVTPPVEEGEYTVYVVNKAGWNPLCVYAYGNGTTGGFGDCKVTNKTDKKYDGQDVYSYTFDKLYTNIIFNENGNSGNSQTGNLDFKANALYIIQTGIGSDNLRICDVVANPTFDNVVTPPVGDTVVKLVGYYQGDEHPSEIELDKDGDVYTAVVSFDKTYYFWLTADGKNYANASANNNTNTGVDRNTTYTATADVNTSRRFVMSNPSGEYVVTATLQGSTITFTVKPRVMPESERTLYFHFGQNFHDHGDLSKGPYVKFYTTQQADGNTDDTNAAIMTKVTGYGLTENDHLYKYVLKEEEAKTYKDAVIYFLHKDNNSVKDFYCCGKKNDGDDYGWDSDNWLKYIYYVDADQKAAQSYITFEEYAAIREDIPDRIYMTGSGFKEFDDAEHLATSTNGCWSITARNLLSADATMNVFYPQFTWSETSQEKKSFNGSDKTGASFKMSWLQPYDWYVKHGNGTEIHAQRCWATFNLGIIGYDQEKVEGNSTLKNALNPQINRDGTPSVLVPLAKTMPHNNYNQFNWFIENQTAEKLTLVVDLDDDCQSVTLLPFEPNPTVDAQGVSVETVEYKYANSVDRWTPGMFKAEDTNGVIFFNHVNMASADALIHAPAATKLRDYHYSVDFELFSNRQRAGRYTANADFGGDVTVHIAGIAFGEGATLGIRGKFTDTETHMTFHTKYSEDTDVATAELKAPAITKVKEKAYTHGSQFIYEVDENGNIEHGAYNEPILIRDNARNPRYTLGARGLLEVTAPDYAADDDLKNLVWYGDFHAMVHEDSDDRNHHNDHPWHANGGELLNEYTPKNKDDIHHHSEYNDAANWAQLLGSAGANFGMASEWHIQLPEVLEVHRTFDADGETWTEDIPETFTVKAQVGAVYPFLIDNDAVIETVQAKSVKAAPRKAQQFTPQTGHTYSIATMPVYSAYEPIVLNASSDLTGIFDVKGEGAPAGDFDENAPVEYYNLQGMRLSAAPESGFYIRRQGSKVEKVLIR